MPTFADLQVQHQFDLASLATDAGVPANTIHMMLSGQAVSPQDARHVLQMASRMASEHWTFENTDIALIDEAKDE